jgi:hypothetical protein
VADETLNSLRTLMRRLLAGTRAGSINWESSGENGFMYERPGASVYVGSDTDGAAPFTIQVYDDEGRVVDEYQSVMRATQEPWVSANNELRDLFSAVRRRSLRIDEVFDSLMADLPEDPDPWASAGPPF